MSIIQLRSVDDYLIGRSCLRRLMKRLQKHNLSLEKQALEQRLPGDFIEPPSNSPLTHRFVENYRIAHFMRRQLRTAIQIYPGQIISFIESYPLTIDTIHKNSLRALSRLSEGRDPRKGEKQTTDSAPDLLIDLLLIINGRIFCIDMIRKSDEGLKLSLLKSDWKLKNEHYLEAAWAVYGITILGYTVSECSVYLLNRDYGKKELTLFTEHQLKKRHKFMRLSIENEIQNMERDLLYQPLPPCSSSQCQLCSQEEITPWNHPNSSENDEQNIYGKPSDIHLLHRSAGTAAALKTEGIYHIAELNRARGNLRRKLKPNHWIQYRAATQNPEQIDVPRIKEFLDLLHWPLYCLDFECFLEALPSWPSVSVWEHVPFLFSAHSMDRDLKARKIGHYIIRDMTDRRAEMAWALIEAMGETGSVLVYGIDLEQKVLLHLADAVPALADKLHTLKERLIDLQTPFTEFAYYHHDQGGKTGLKTVLGLLSTRTYPQQRILSGSSALAGYYYLMHRDIPIPWDEYAKYVRNDPESFFREVVEYCDTDSIALTDITRFLIQKSAWEG